MIRHLANGGKQGAPPEVHPTFRVDGQSASGHVPGYAVTVCPDVDGDGLPDPCEVCRETAEGTFCNLDYPGDGDDDSDKEDEVAPSEQQHPLSPAAAVVDVPPSPAAVPVVEEDVAKEPIVTSIANTCLFFS